jgi:hypothetical protein
MRPRGVGRWRGTGPWNSPRGLPAVCRERRGAPPPLGSPDQPRPSGVCVRGGPAGSRRRAVLGWRRRGRTRVPRRGPARRSVRQRSRGARALGLLWEQDPLDVAEDGASGVQRTVRVVPNRVTQIGWVASRHCPRGEPVELFYVVLRQQPFGHQPHESRDVMGAWEIDAPCNQHRLDRLLGRCCAMTHTHLWDVPSPARRCAVSRSSVA